MDSTPELLRRRRALVGNFLHRVSWTLGIRHGLVTARDESSLNQCLG